MQALPIGSLNDLPGRIEAGIEINGTEDSLQRIRQYRVTAMTAALTLTTTEMEVLAQSQLTGYLSKCHIIYERCAQATEVALRRIRVRAENDFRDYEIKNSVTEKLEPLVVVAGHTAMRQREFEQPRIGKFVIQRFF